MGITRGPLSADNFTIVPNHWARTARLSYKAKGLLLAIASHAAGYRLTVDQLIAESSESRTAVRSGLAELEAAGYLIRERGRDVTTGRLSTYTWHLVEDPHGDSQGTKPAGGPDQDVNPVSAGQAQSTFSAGGSRPPKKTREEDQVEDQELGGRSAPQTPLAARSATRPARQWRPRVPKTIRDQGPVVVAAYTKTITDERERIAAAVAAGKVPF